MATDRVRISLARELRYVIDVPQTQQTLTPLSSTSVKAYLFKLDAAIEKAIAITENTTLSVRPKRYAAMLKVFARMSAELDLADGIKFLDWGVQALDATSDDVVKHGKIPTSVTMHLGAFGTTSAKVLLVLQQCESAIEGVRHLSDRAFVVGMQYTSLRVKEEALAA
ncbi:hypothetical protein PRZ48_010244 [Zasmidium cellare]|uniref:Uncharacterized protein n=1 Tax=Zasmidium cellare TaxID=395010 RepID=A0ABR0E8P4_ZASCE|nr:hypothetical protein PRZ48_010244 [Zasmidium cellare]